MKGHTLLRQAFLALAAISSTTVDAHSWVEQLQRLASNGTMITPLGYQRGFVARDNPLFKGDISDDLWQLPPNDRAAGAVLYASDPICSPQQSSSNYTNSDFPMLVTAPGDYIAMQHQENGHVSLPTTQANKPRNRGTIYIYGTDQAKSNDTLLAIHNVWNVNGTGGDGRGRLLATRNYDDGQCYQVNSGAISTSRQAQFKKVAANPMGSDLWCQTDIQLPTDITTGANYTLYWVWDWPTLNKANAMIGEEGVNVTKPEIYTSCIDMQIVDPCSEDLGDVKSPACSSVKTKSNFAHSFAKGQSYSAAAVPQELTGNFAVAIDDTSADSGSNNGMSAPPNFATGGATGAATGAGAGTATATTLQTVTTSSSTADTSAVGATTVTVAMSTVTVTQVSSPTFTEASWIITNRDQGVETVTVTAGGAQSTQSTLTAALVTEGANGAIGVAAHPTVEPFMNRRRSRIEARN